jgi:hypothetical protein
MSGKKKMTKTTNGLLADFFIVYRGDAFHQVGRVLVRILDYRDALESGYPMKTKPWRLTTAIRERCRTL